jgi:predicted transcriptional regulator
MKRDPSLDALLELDGQVLVVDPASNHWVRFVVRRVPATETKPHGLDYVLSLLGPSGERLVGFDKAIARGDLRPSRDNPKVWFTSPESFAKVLSNKNRALLNLIAATQPDSLRTLVARTGRKASNLSRTLRTMERYGFVRLHKGVRGKIRPEVPYRSISLELSLEPAA